MSESDSTLSDVAQHLAECYAVVFPASPSRSKAMKWLNQARKAVGGVKGFTSTEISAACEELMEAHLLQPSQPGGRGAPARGPCAMPGTITRFCLAAIERGTARGCLDGLDSELYRSPWMPEPELPEHLEQHVRLAVLSDTFERFADRDLPLHIWFWLTEPRAEPFLRSLPSPHRERACNLGLNTLVHHLRPIDTFARAVEQIAPDPWTDTVVARTRLLQGRFDEARVLIERVEANGASDTRTRIECACLTAMHGFLQGDDERAATAIGEALERERDGSRRRILYPDSVPFTIALPALVRLGSTDARARFSSLLEARRKLKLGSILDGWLQAANGAAQSRPAFVPLNIDGAPSVATVLDAIASRWNRSFHIQVDHPAAVEILETLVRAANHGGYALLTAELQSVLTATVSSPARLSEDVREFFAASSAADRHAALGSHSLIPLVRPVAPWESALRSLEEIASMAQPKAAGLATDAAGANTRLAWQIGVEPHGDIVSATPIEQKRGKQGRWSSGRRVALKRLREQSDEFPHLSAQDRKACGTIRKIMPSAWHAGAPTYQTDERTVFALAGHPHVLDENAAPLEIVAIAPELHIERGDDAVLVRLLPPWSGRHYQARHDEHAQRVEVAQFGAAHRRVAEVIPTGGLRLPLSANERLQALLGNLAADISVHGDEATGTAELQEGDAEPLLVLEPAGASLRVRLRVEPLAGTPSHFDAGIGGAVVYVRTSQESIAVRRDLDEERRRAQALVLRSEVLSRHHDGRAEIVLETTFDALELLDEVQEHRIRCVWPSGVSFKLTGRASVSSVSLEIRSAKDWLTTDGSLALGNDDEIRLARLLSLMRAQPDSRFVDLGAGEYLALSRTLKQQLDTLQAFAQPAATSTATSDEPPRVHPLGVLALEPLFEGATLTGNAGWKRLRRRVEQAITHVPEVPVALDADLRAYQREGFEWLDRLGRIGAGACLADDMGLGKTVQTLAVLLARASDGPALVVAPTSVVGNWLAETQRFAPTLNVLDYGAAGNRADLVSGLEPYDVVLLSYGLLVNEREAITGVQWHSVVLDEAQAIKNAGTRRAASARALNADFRLATTGTPVQNSLMDLHSLFAFLNPRLLGSEAAFRKRFAVPITRGDAHARDQLHTLVSPFLLRRHKRDVLRELPARTELVLRVELSTQEASLYESMRQEALDALETSAETETLSSDGADKGSDGRRKFEILSHLMRLRRLCCHPALVAPDWAGPAAKLGLFIETLNELIEGGHKALVFSQFVDNLKIVEAELQQRDIAYQYIDGGVSAAQRTERVRAFQSGEGDAFLISLTAGGTGLNLTAADYVIHLDPWWNPAVEDQASDRAHRLGQQRPVTIVRMVTRGTIEERIEALHGRKRELADSVLAGADQATLDVEAMMGLLRG